MEKTALTPEQLKQFTNLGLKIGDKATALIRDEFFKSAIALDRVTSPVVLNTVAASIAGRLAHINAGMSKIPLDTIKEDIIDSINQCCEEQGSEEQG